MKVQQVAQKNQGRGRRPNMYSQSFRKRFTPMTQVNRYYIILLHIITWKQKETNKKF